MPRGPSALPCKNPSLIPIVFWTVSMVTSRLRGLPDIPYWKDQQRTAMAPKADMVRTQEIEQHKAQCYICKQMIIL